MPNPKAKYTTLKQLSAAFASGELDNSYRLILDKLGCQLHLMQIGPEEGADERYEKCQALFRREYGDPLKELLALAGIPAEWC